MNSNSQARINQIMNERGLKQIDILHMSKPYQDKYGIKMSKSHLSQYVNGKSTPDQKKLFLLAETLKVSEAWLMGLDVPMERQRQSNSDILPIYNRLNETSQKEVYNFASKKLDQQENSLKSSKSQAEVIQFQPKRKQKPKTVIALGYASAGTGEFLVDEQKIETTYYGSIPDYDYALIVNGDSMEPMFQDGQIIFVDKLDGDTSFLDGQIVIAELNGCAYIKKLRLYSDHAQLISMNNRYDPIEISADDEFMIVGKVIL